MSENNRVELQGVLSSQYYPRVTPTGKTYVDVRIGVLRDRNGETDWYTVRYWGTQAEHVTQLIEMAKAENMHIKVRIIGELRQYQTGGEDNKRTVYYVQGHRLLVDGGSMPFNSGRE